MSSPLETPPSTPPALFCGRVKRVGLPFVFRSVVDGVVDAGTKGFGSLHAAADLHGLDRLHAHHRLGELAVERSSQLA